MCFNTEFHGHLVIKNILLHVHNQIVTIQQVCSSVMPIVSQSSWVDVIVHVHIQIHVSSKLCLLMVFLLLRIFYQLDGDKSICLFSEVSIEPVLGYMYIHMLLQNCVC